ncbi:hypothetical protein [Ferrimonas lipolytica]|uniref:ATP synthase I chain n=1 Tax=Ferrimonas lipolytica TaxID=2724191 RepID=A0A6H1UCF5_9GAMM|nr:hypothetical protein [Ferrimonas lipolytica]QIZ76260.1 hypothetical protein HER31_04750 [Ferrimonas lipolytica]
MKESFRIWFIVEISLFSAPVALVAVLIPLILSKGGSSLGTTMFMVSMMTSCFMAIFSVINLMLFSFSNKAARFKKTTIASLVLWLVHWLATCTFLMADYGVKALLSLVPVAVVAHLAFISKAYFQSET